MSSQPNIINTLQVSHFLWVNVILPSSLAEDEDVLWSFADAFFPLVALCCKRVVDLHIEDGDAATGEALASAARARALRPVQWLALRCCSQRMTMSITARINFMSACCDTPNDDPRILSWVCNGLAPEFLPRNDKAVRLAASTCLKAACRHGFLRIAETLTDGFSLTSDEARSRKTLSTACRSGSVKTVEWVATRFSFAKEDAISEDALAKACCDGHIETAKWVSSFFELEPTDACVAFCSACAAGQLEAAKWVCKHFSLLEEKKKVADSYISPLMALSGTGLAELSAVTDWLSKQCQLTEVD